ncbi:MAG: glycosyltransferase family 4 protein [Symplocastrum torsivum CPER-KK1]|uniref:Glycosyltransferase family 4 protein n=1 Tax=Symplocastrum torsivum CPER-KK1 TaxID=450513 RepID=A0A951PJH0_9CYAN|nr:glycosyltransferase family 4 protein [Symplocastrum torsivum CPER-KK1]
MSSKGIELIGLATASSSETYKWKTVNKDTEIELRVAFPNCSYFKILPGEMKRAIHSILDEINPNAVVISGYSLKDSQAAMAWCLSRRRLAILMSESKADDSPRHPIKELFKRYLISKFDAAICGGTPHLGYLEQLGMPSERIFQKYDVVDNKYFELESALHRADKSLSIGLPGLDDRRTYFLASSRFIKRKNLPRLFQAYKIYRNRQPDGWRLIVMGSGEEETKLKRMISEEAIPDVVFPGFRQINELPAYYAHAGAFVHPALNEQWGLVVNEAMACGLPILSAASVGCAYDLIKEGENGFKFNPENVTEMAQAMERTASNSTARDVMGHRSREIISDWTPQHFAKNLWKAILAGQNRGNPQKEIFT